MASLPAPSRRTVVRSVPFFTGAVALGGLAGCSERGGAAAPPVGSGQANPTVVPEASHGPLGQVPGGRPNVIVLSIDDLGWRDLGCYGNTFNETPHIDRLSAEGVTFDQAYSAAAICSPSRAALVTGLYPGRVGITDFLRPQEAPSDVYLDPAFGGVGPVLGSRGYRVGLIGKWHLTERFEGPYRTRAGNPFDHGFTDVVASEELYIGPGDYFAPYYFLPQVNAPEGEYLTDRLTHEALELVTRDRHRPFWLHLSNYAVHTTLGAKPDLLEKYQNKPGSGDPANNPTYAAMLESVDAQVGALVSKLEELGIAEKTLLLVTSDNGAQSRPANKPLRGGKGELHEGGIRVPLVAWSPGFVRQGYREATLTQTVDLLPTCAELAGATLPRPVDGISIVPLLTGRGTVQARDTLYWAYPHFIGLTRPHAAIRQGNLKLIQRLRRGDVSLFDLSTDPGEQHNLAPEQPAVAERLTRALEAHLAELHLYPDAPPPRGRAARGAQEVDLDFTRPPQGWRQLSLAGSASFAALDGGWRLRSTGTSEVLAVSSVSPASPNFSLVLDPTFSEGTGTAAISLGLVKDARNLLLVSVDHYTGRISWKVTRNGVQETLQVEPLAALTHSVNLNRKGSLLGLSMEGSRGSVWYDRGIGQGWEFLFRFDVAGVLDLADDEVRSQYRYAVAGEVNGASVGVKALRATRGGGPRRVSNR